MLDFGARTRFPILGRTLSAVAVVVGIGACGETVSQLGDVDVVTLRLFPDSARLGTGRTLRIQALPLDGTGALLPQQTASWSSRDATIATVDEAGVVTGVSEGTVEIVATVAGFEATASVEVARPPTLGFARDSVTLSARAGGPDPVPDTVMVLNLGDLPLDGLAIDSIVYGAAAEGWLTAQLGSASAPATLALQGGVEGVTQAGTYTSVVWLSGLEADGSPAGVTVTMAVAAGDATGIVANDGDGQTATVGSSVAISPSVRVADAFDNPVAGADIVFAVTGGAGSVTGGLASTDAEGVARVGAWTLGTLAGSNALTATLAGVGSADFAATGTSGPAATLELLTGDGQSAVAGAAVAIAPSVIARDGFGNGVAGVAVAFAVSSGGGSSTGSAQSTGADGVASVGSWNLGTVAGVNTLVATADVLTDSVTFVATGLSGEASAIVLHGGDAQTDTVAATLTTAYAVRVVDANGNGVEGIPVSWSVSGGGGSIGPASSTGSDGVAVATRVLGTTAGIQTAQGAVGGLAGSPISFSATAEPGAPAVLTVVAGDGQTTTVDTEVDTAPSVSVSDQFGNPIGGHDVTFAVTAGGGATLPAAAVPTGTDGIATVTSWTLGTVSGTDNNTLSATATAIGGSSATFTASATADVPDSITVASGDGQTAITDVNVANPPSARVADRFGNGVPGVAVAFSPSGTGAVGTALATTNASGVAVTTWTVRVGGATVGTDGSFANTLAAAVQGTGLATSFDGFAIYSYGTHVNPLWSGCTGCHATASPTSGLALDQTSAGNYTALVNVVPVCDGGLGTSFRRISPAGGVDAADVFSVLMRLLDPGLSNAGDCAHPFPWNATSLDLVRAWVRNGAPNN